MVKSGEHQLSNDKPFGAEASWHSVEYLRCVLSMARQHDTEPSLTAGVFVGATCIRYLLAQREGQRITALRDELARR